LLRLNGAAGDTRHIRPSFSIPEVIPVMAEAGRNPRRKEAAFTAAGLTPPPPKSGLTPDRSVDTTPTKHHILNKYIIAILSENGGTIPTKHHGLMIHDTCLKKQNITERENEIDRICKYSRSILERITNFSKNNKNNTFLGCHCRIFYCRSGAKPRPA